MLQRIWRFVWRRSLTQRFTLASFLIIISGTAGIGWWVGEQIKADVIKESATTTALYMDSFIAPNLQELSYTKTLLPAHVAALGDLLRKTTLGRQVVTFKVWDADGQVIYSTNPALIGRVFPIDEDQASSWRGQVVAGISDLQNAENVEDRRFNTRLLQIYSPVRLNGTGQIIAVAEFYQSVDALEAEISAAQIRSWFVVGSAMTAIFLLLVGFVRWAGKMIGRQEITLHQQVMQLTELLAQNADLHERVRRAAASVATLDERFLRRISAELHDGPAQEIGLSLLQLDGLSGFEPGGTPETSQRRAFEHPLTEIRSSLRRALGELRSISAGLGLPHLESMTMEEILTRVVRSHERRTGTSVSAQVDEMPQHAPLPVKITVYRLIQESLNNAFRHAGGAGQRIGARQEAGVLRIEVADRGPGFDVAQALNNEEHLGLAGMRERVESLGGQFQIESDGSQGTKVRASLLLQNIGGGDE
ncbi:MAG TPA: sensor histidine kinase [Ktedonobacterales bacterium]|nr:sensor histidine kinase [Ktedonobacterales bacterium]